MGKVIRLTNETEKKIDELKEDMIKLLTKAEIEPIMKEFYKNMIFTDDNMIIQLCIDEARKNLKK